MSKYVSQNRPLKSKFPIYRTRHAYPRQTFLKTADSPVPKHPVPCKGAMESEIRGFSIHLRRAVMGIHIRSLFRVHDRVLHACKVEGTSWPGSMKPSPRYARYS